MVSVPNTSGASSGPSKPPGSEPTSSGQSKANVPLADINREPAAKPLSANEKRKNKRKAEQQERDEEIKRVKGGSLLENFPGSEIANTLSNWHNGKARSRDYPRTKPYKNMIMFKDCMVIVKSQKELDPTKLVLRKIKLRLVVDSQAPGLKFLLPGGYQFLCRSHHFKKGIGNIDEHQNRVNFPLIDEHRLKADPKVIFNLFKDSFQMELIREDLELMDENLGKSKEFHAMGFQLDGRFWFDRTPELSSTPTQIQQSRKDDAHSFLAILNSGRNTVVCIQSVNDYYPVINAYWSGFLKLANLKGDWSHYEKVIAGRISKLFSKWYGKGGNPNKEIMRQHWMQVVGTDESTMQYASTFARRNFANPKEIETIMSVALIAEAMWDNINIASHYSEHVTHSATVGPKDDLGNRTFHVLVTKTNDFSMPATPAGTQLKVSFPPAGISEKSQGKLPAAKGQKFDPDYNREVAQLKKLTISKNKKPAANAGPSSAPAAPIATPANDPTKGQIKEKEWKKVKPKPQPAKKGPVFPEFDCRVIDLANSPGDISISVKITDKVLGASFVEGAEVRLALIMKRNVIPQMRQMEAIAELCSVAKEGDDKLQMMQSFLVGDNAPSDNGEKVPSIKEDYFSRMKDEEKKAFETFYKSCKFNGPQKRFWSGIFDKEAFITMMQGPPGTGKTTTLAATALGFALLRCRTLLTAPSNIAAQECMKKLIDHLNTLYAACPEMEDDFKVVYLPTAATTRRDLAEQDAVDEKTLSDMVADGEQPTEDPSFEKFKLWNHIVRAYQKDQRDKELHPASQRKRNASTWLTIRKQTQLGAKVSPTARRSFYDLTEAMTRTIFKDPAVRICVCTSSTAALLAEYEWAPWAVLIDESAFATEQDSYVPLSLKGRYNVLAGDHEQLKPIVRSLGHNEFGKQLGLSLYERFYGKESMPLFRLKINYRMHPQISELPGNVTYEWLENAACTWETSSDEFEFFKDWWYSESARTYRHNRRAPAFGLKKDESRIHRLFVNVKTGESAPKPGTQSQMNYGNINAIADMAMSIMKHQTSQDKPALPYDKITILTPYKAESMELVKQVKMRIREVWGDEVGRFPLFSTIDSTQGGQNEIILLSLTPANLTNGSLIGFLREWNRMNVALTRAQSVLVMFGNLDAWRSQLAVLVKGMRCKKLGLFIMDLLDYGDIIDIDGDNTLPADITELPDHATWSKILPSVPASQSQISKKNAAIHAEYIADKEMIDELEKSLLKELRAIRANANEKREKFRKGDDVEAPLRFDLDGDKKEDESDSDSEVENDEDEIPAGTVRDAIMTDAEMELIDERNLQKALTESAEMQLAGELAAQDGKSDEDMTDAGLPLRPKSPAPAAPPAPAPPGPPGLPGLHGLPARPVLQQNQGQGGQSKGKGRGRGRGGSGFGSKPGRGRGGGGRGGGAGTGSGV